jgi:hypothetical protein
MTEDEVAATIIGLKKVYRCCAAGWRIVQTHWSFTEAGCSAR